MSIVNQIINKRFNSLNLPKNLRESLKKVIGPLSNFYNVKTVHKLNYRIFLKEKHYNYRIVNTHSQKNIFNFDDYIKSFFRVYSDGIFMSVIFYFFNYFVG